MDLFNQHTNQNLLPLDGEVYHHGQLLDSSQIKSYYNELLTTIQWEHDELFMFGKLIKTKRKVAWYGSKRYEYSYSKVAKKALPWNSVLITLKQLIEQKTGETYNSCLLNLYHSGEEGMSWHSDDEKMLVKNASIASLSLGGTRKFLFKHKETAAKVAVILENGSLLEMKEATQLNWLHALPKTKKVVVPRVNLTFRSIVD
jgi:alkylated DNA repair dioxygenase AlkB